VLQGVSFTLRHHGVLGIVGRNGMGKTTLCNAIMGLVRAAKGSVRLDGQEVLGMHPYRIVDLGVGYVPQGRRVWPSLTVDEHLRVAAKTGGPWNLELIYELFPPLSERRRHGGNELSGGEQQMLSIGRALVANPKLLIMDEPSEGLAPRIVEQLEKLLVRLADEEDLAVLLVEQNLGVATTVAKRLAVMVNGQIETEIDSAALADNRTLQQRLLGVSAETEEAVSEFEEQTTPAAEQTPSPREPSEVVASDSKLMNVSKFPNRWSFGNPLTERRQFEENRAGIAKQITRWGRVANLVAERVSAVPAGEISSSIDTQTAMSDKVAYVAGTFDTKNRELSFVRNIIASQGVRAVTVDLSTSGQPTPADIRPQEVAQYHPHGPDAVFTGERGSAVTAMAEAFAQYMPAQKDVGGVIGLGGSGGTALTTPGMQALNVGIPKIMVSTVASGNVAPYVGASDICMLYSVTDVAGINRISERVLANAANALVGMMIGKTPKAEQHKPAIGLTMFGVTTPCVQLVTRKLEHKYDCLIFHATGTGGRSMEKLVDSGIMAGVIDVTTTEICDLHMGGVMSAGEDRLGAIIRTSVPYVGSCGALEIVNFGAPDTVPEKYRSRNLYRHNPQVTVFRTTPEESALIGEWVGRKLNQMDGPVRFLLPEGGLSLLDLPGKPLHDPEADAALFNAIERTVKQTEKRRLIRLPYDVNNPAFADALVSNFNEIMRDT
jgi:uncharacterized protein (UPF0261 family)/ABC-type branched-subunit amino acid transport system ATPase component